MKKLLLLLTVLSATLTTSANGMRPKVIELTANERQLVTDNSDFAFNLFRKTRDTENHVISPLSITYALGMLNNGADGITREEICQVLSGGRQEGYADVAAMNAFCRKMLLESALLDEDTRVAIANTIYFNGDRKDISLKSAFKEAAATYYDATPSIVSFSNPATLDVINQWASDHTDGMIPDLLTPEDLEDPNLVSFLLNAICFKGSWTFPFQEGITMKTYFDDMKRTAMMMGQVNEFKYAETDLYQSVILPYGNGSYQMTLFLPRNGKTLDDVLAAMNGTNWNVAEYKNYQVMLNMPRIETDTDQNLNDIMASLGMPNAFLQYDGHGFMDFCYFGDNEDNADRCWIGMMKQKAHLKLDEKGTEAAAVTVVEMTDKAEHSDFAEFIADRPFLYVISERSTGSIFFIGQYMGEPLENPSHAISLSEEERQLVKSNNDFAFRLFRKTREESNLLLSPLSVTYALGMLNNGAAGQTQQEINQVLGFDSADALNNFCRKMLDESGTLDKTTKVLIGNTIFVNEGKGYYLQDGFVEKANQFYDAEPQSRDFADGLTRDVINQWASDHTEGMIKEVLSKLEFKDYVASYLLNALYFKGTWANKFNPAYTQDEPFNGKETLPMMHQEEDLSYTENDLYQAVNLPYGNGAYQMTVFLPREGKTLKDLLGSLNADNWYFEGAQYMVDLKLPRFETSTDESLKEVMKALGMPTAFDPSNAEFPYFCNYPGYIDLMKQVAKIKVDEEGTEAAAITVIGYATTGMPQFKAFWANRPFFYIISERSSNVIFFMGQFTGSTTTAIDAQPIFNGQFSTPNSETLYDLQGRKLSNSQIRKGLYISGGKKVVLMKE